jgi:hypothetical protein
MEPSECVKVVDTLDPVKARTVRLKDSDWEWVWEQVGVSDERNMSVSLWFERLIARERERVARAEARRSA